ncbi:MAG: hypothetical protein M3Y22_06455 [Pseudomonadota bacterium]|nr:hypothetical protein [Pseudomonadota bacterium]
MDVDWLKERKREAGVTDADLAALLGVERSVANRVVNGKIGMSANKVGAAAKLLKVERSEFMFRMGMIDADDLPPTNSEVDGPDLVAMQQIDLAYGLGAQFVDGHVEVEVLHFPKIWVESITSSPPALLTWARGRGDSMTPTIHDGDLVLLDRSQRRIIEPDALWAYTVGEFGAIKRLRVKGDRVVILSDNPAVPPDEEPIDEVNIIARVIFIGRRT